MKILVTGGAGFIGSHVVDAYLRAGHEVVVVDNLFTGKRENVNPAARFYEIDIRDAALEEIFEEERPEVVNHHAAQISVPVSVENPVFDAQVNIIGLLNLLQCSVKYGVKKIIFASSGGAIYGEATEYPTSENYPPLPLSPYAIAKLTSEYYLRFYEHQYGLDYTILRYANIYGPRQIPKGEAGVVAIFTENLLSGRPSVLHHFPDEPGGMERDYCYVEDVAKANVMALERGSKGLFNIGSGKPTKTRELYQMLYELLNNASPSLKVPISAPPRPGDIKYSCLKIDRARNLLGWRPDTELKEGLKKTIQWYSKIL